MENEGSIDVKYTENARNRLIELQKEYVSRMEYHLKRRKYQKGKDFIEVTTADLDRVAKHYQYVRDTEGKVNILTLYVVFVIGLLATVTGVSWDFIHDLLKGRDADGNRQFGHAITLLSGLTMVIVSIALYYYMKLQDREKKKVREQRTMRK